MKSDAMTRNPERTRARILAAATARFARHGFDGTTVDAIARDARANPALISYYFGGKQKLYMEVIRECLRDVRPRLARIRESKAPAEARLEAFVRTFAGFAAERPAFPAIVLREHLAGGRRFDRYILPEFLEFFATTRAIVEDGIAAGDFRPVDPHALHLSVIGGLVLFFSSAPMRARLVRGHLDATDPTAEEFAVHTIRLFLAGIRSDCHEDPPSPPGAAARRRPPRKRRRPNRA